MHIRFTISTGCITYGIATPDIVALINPVIAYEICVSVSFSWPVVARGLDHSLLYCQEEYFPTWVLTVKINQGLVDQASPGQMLILISVL